MKLVKDLVLTGLIVWLSAQLIGCGENVIWINPEIAYYAIQGE